MSCQTVSFPFFRCSNVSNTGFKFWYTYVCLVCVLFFLNVIHVTLAFYPKEIILNDNQIVKKWEVASQYFDSISWYERDFIQHSLDKFLHSYQEEKDADNKSKNLFSDSNLNFTSIRTNFTSDEKKVKGANDEMKTRGKKKVGMECLKSLHVIDSALKSRKFWTYQSMYQEQHYPIDPYFT